MSISVPKWTFFLFLCVSKIISFLFLTFPNCQAGNVSRLCYSLSAAAFASRIFIAFGIGINL